MSKGVSCLGSLEAWLKPGHQVHMTYWNGTLQEKEGEGSGKRQEHGLRLSLDLAWSHGGGSATWTEPWSWSPLEVGGPDLHTPVSVKH